MEDPGYKSVTFDASALPSGMYTCKITAGTFGDVIKLVLIKQEGPVEELDSRRAATTPRPETAGFFLRPPSERGLAVLPGRDPDQDLRWGSSIVIQVLRKILSHHIYSQSERCRFEPDTSPHFGLGTFVRWNLSPPFDEGGERSEFLIFMSR